MLPHTPLCQGPISLPRSQCGKSMRSPLGILISERASNDEDWEKSYSKSRHDIKLNRLRIHIDQLVFRSRTNRSQAFDFMWRQVEIPRPRDRSIVCRLWRVSFSASPLSLITPSLSQRTSYSALVSRCKPANIDIHGDAFASKTLGKSRRSW